MDFPSEYTTNVYTIPIENIGMIFREEIFPLNSSISLGDLNTVERANQARPGKEEPNEKNLQALARRQRRLDGLQLFEKTKLNR
jgi:hypothetical protein